MKIAFALLAVLTLASEARASSNPTRKAAAAKGTACAAPNHVSHSNTGAHPFKLHTDADAKKLGDECTIAKVKAANHNRLPAWAANTTICLPAECELGHASDEHNAATDRKAAGMLTFKEHLTNTKSGACKYLADLSKWAHDNKVKAAMGGAAIDFATVDGICHFVAEGVSEFKPEWHLDPHTISTACAGLAGVTLAGAHAAAHGVSMCTATGAIKGGAATPAATHGH